MEKKAEFEQLIAEKMAEFNVPGVSIGVLTADGPEYFTAGVTNIDHPLPVTADTLFQVGSNTKLMTATLIVLLAHQGKIDLDAPIRSVLPDFRVQDETASTTATIRQLLTHSAGWVGDHFIETGSGDDALDRYVSSMAQLPQLAPINFSFSYNNSSFALAGAIIEKITGKPFEDALVDMLFEPLGMQNSLIRAGEVMLRSFAVGHSVEDDQVQVAGPWPLPKAMYAAGAVAASAGDMLTFAQFYLDGGKTADGVQAIPKEVMAQMWQPQFEIGHGEGSVAHSWFVEDTGGHTAYRHGGATVGQLSAFKLIPSKNFAFVSLTNGQMGTHFNNAIEAWLIENVCDIKPDAEPAPFNPSDAMVAELVGIYSRPIMDLEIKLEGNKLIAQIRAKQGFPTENDPPRPPTPWFEVKMISTDAFKALEGPVNGSQSQLIRRPDGTLGWVRFGSRLNIKQVG